MTDHKSFGANHGQPANGRSSSRRRAAAAVLLVVSVPVLLGMAAMTVDVGYVYLVRQELQTSADAAALAAVWTMIDQDGTIAPEIAQAQAATFAALNSAESVVQLDFGWIDDPADQSSPFIMAAPDAANAIRVTARRTSATGNPVDLFFAGIFGFAQTDISASAVAAFTPAAVVDVTPLALPGPGFGPVDPEVAEANPGKDGPSAPLDGTAFLIGEQVTLFAFGTGKKSPVHLLLNTNDIPGEAQLGKVLSGEEPPAPLAVGDEVDVVGEGTGHNALGRKLAERLDDFDPANDIIVVAVVEALPDSRNAEGELDGNVRIVDFVAVHLDGIIEAEVPDPNDPQDSGKTINIELLVGTVLQLSVSGTPGTASSGVVDGVSVGIPQLVR